MTLAIVLVLSGLFGARLYHFAQKSHEMRPDMAQKELRFTACPNKPNCVSTMETSKEHKFEAFEVLYTISEIKEKLEAMPNMKLIYEDLGYLHFEYTSPTMKYVDDVEIALEGATLHMKSASRVGYSDMGANRKRLESIANMFRGER